MIEVVCEEFPRGPKRAAIFDFDGTLSLLRRNWQDVMIPMMVSELSATGTQESPATLRAHVEEFVMKLNGRQTIYQMMRLADEIKRRGGQPLDPLLYKHRYHDLLWRDVGQRINAVRVGRIPAEQMTVPGSLAVLRRLRDLGLVLYLASGTDLKYVQDELEVLGLADYFGDHVYGALDEYQAFSKAMIIEQMLGCCGFQGHEIVAFGDGFVEIEETKKVGGLAIGVASNEESRQGVNDWKRQRLIRAGADIVIGDFREQDALFELVEIT